MKLVPNGLCTLTTTNNYETMAKDTAAAIEVAARIFT